MGLDAVELLLRTEEVFAVDLPDDECAQVRTIGDLYRLVLGKLNLSYESAAVIETEVLGRDRSQRLLQAEPWTTPDVWFTLKGVIVDQLQVDEDEVRESVRFVDDLGCD